MERNAHNSLSALVRHPFRAALVRLAQKCAADGRHEAARHVMTQAIDHLGKNGSDADRAALVTLVRSEVRK